MVVRLAALLGISLIFAGCTSCIEFDKQTMVFRHYPKTDTLVIWQQYEGIHGEGEGDELRDEEIELSKKGSMNTEVQLKHFVSN